MTDEFGLCSRRDLVEKRERYDVFRCLAVMCEEDPPIVTIQAWTKDGNYIGDMDTAIAICDDRQIVPELSRPCNRVCSIGWSEKSQMWYGWSHRAICGFGIGSQIMEGELDRVERDDRGGLPGASSEMQEASSGIQG